jgi:hypothetical protein
LSFSTLPPAVHVSFVNFAEQVWFRRGEGSWFTQNA